jgi:hypothetical protein
VDDPAHGDGKPRERRAQTVLGEASHPDRVADSQRLHRPAQGAVAGLEQGGALGGRELVRGEVSAGRVVEEQGAVVGHEEALEESLRRAETIASPAPQACPAHLLPAAAKAQDLAIRVLARRPKDGLLDAQPVAHNGHGAEGDPGLRHAPGARVHAQKEHLAWPSPVLLEIAAVRPVRIAQGVVDMGDPGAEAQALQGRGQLLGDLQRADDQSA